MSVAAAGVPLTNPKKGPKSRVAVNPGGTGRAGSCRRPHRARGSRRSPGSGPGRPPGRELGADRPCSRRRRPHDRPAARRRWTGAPEVARCRPVWSASSTSVPGQRWMVRAGEPGGEPVLQGEPADLPEPLGDRRPARRGGSPPAPDPQRCPPGTGRRTASSPARTAARRGGGRGRSARRRARPAAPPTRRRSGGRPRSAPGLPTGPRTAPGRRCGPPGRAGPIRAQSGRLVKKATPGAATTASAATRSPLSSTASNRPSDLASSATGPRGPRSPWPAGTTRHSPGTGRWAGIDLCRVDGALLQVRLQGVDRGCVQVPVGSRAQEHPRGHVVLPEAHRPADDHGVDTVLAGQGGGRQGVGPGPDDQQRRGSRHRPVPPRARPAGVGWLPPPA